MQGLTEFIPTDVKAAYINQLLRVGFNSLDFGSFVSPKAIPQMRDTAEVLAKLDLSGTTTKLLAIVANQRGAEDACQYDQIDYLGYPFSISETFQLRNTNATLAESVERTQAIQELCNKHNKQLVLYISMGFGNPYGDPWNTDIVQKWVYKLVPFGIRIFSLYDTIGGATRLRAMVDRFYDLMELEPEFAGLRSMHPPTTEGSRDKLFMFLSGWMGGPDLFVEQFGHPRLRARHLPFAIGTSERDQWLRAMAWAMQDVGIAEPLRLRLMESFYQTADWMRNKAD